MHTLISNDAATLIMSVRQHLVCGGKVRLRGQVDVSESSPGGAGRDEY